MLSRFLWPSVRFLCIVQRFLLKSVQAWPSKIAEKPRTSSSSWALESHLCSGLLEAPEWGHWSTTRSVISVCICAVHVDGAAWGSALAAWTRFQQRRETGLWKSNQLYRSYLRRRKSTDRIRLPVGLGAIGAGACLSCTEEEAPNKHVNAEGKRGTWWEVGTISSITLNTQCISWSKMRSKKIYLQQVDAVCQCIMNAWMNKTLGSMLL